MSKKYNGPKILIVDIETRPMEAWIWQLYDITVPLNMIKKQGNMLSWSAIWYGEPDSKLMYEEVKHNKTDDDEVLVTKLHKLMNEADIIVGQNSDRFDLKYANTRFVKHGLHKIKPHKTRDTMKIAKKHFNLPSYSLEFMGEFFEVKHRKMKDRKFPGFELWKACMAGIKAAWIEMKKYNGYDVLTTRDIFEILIPWDQGLNYSVYRDNEGSPCCDKPHLVKRGYRYTDSGVKNQIYFCKSCEGWSTGKENLNSNKQTLKKA